MARIKGKDVEIHISPDNSAGSYSLLANGRTFSADFSNTSDEEDYVFGSDDPIISAGDKQRTFSVTALFDPADTNGQNLLRTAYDTDGTIFIARLTDNTPGSEQGYTVPCTVTKIGEQANREDRWAEHTFEFKATAAPTTLATGLP